MAGRLGNCDKEGYIQGERVCASTVTKTKRERPKNGDENRTLQTLKKWVSSGHIDLFYTPLESS